MAAGPKTTIWPIEPHTIAKIDILEAYLVAYFQILGTCRRQEFLYIDGFAGPNRYTNRDWGSPSAAINAAITAIGNTTNAWVAGNIHFAFVECDPKRYAVLDDSLSEYSPIPGISVLRFNAQFTDALPLIKNAVPEPFTSNAPLFAFIDPFGATGAPFAFVSEILNSPCSEVLLNFDADGVSRIYQAKQNANHEELLTQIFGDTTWQTRLHDGQSFDEQCRTAFELYKEKLRGLPGVRYIFEVEMRGKTGKMNYFLVFASKHPLGLVKMKEAMKRITQNGSYTFNDTDVGQQALLRFDEPKAYYMSLYSHFKQRRVKYDGENDDVTAFALNHTPFFNAKSMLKLLEDEEFITASSTDPKRRRGTFNHAVTEIDFHGKAQNGQLF